MAPDLRIYLSVTLALQRHFPYFPYTALCFQGIRKMLFYIKEAVMLAYTLRDSRLCALYADCNVSGPFFFLISRTEWWISFWFVTDSAQVSCAYESLPHFPENLQRICNEQLWLGKYAHFLAFLASCGMEIGRLGWYEDDRIISEKGQQNFDNNVNCNSNEKWNKDITWTQYE